MKRILIAGALALAAGGQALAADLPPAPPPPPRAPAAYIPAPIPYYNWTGFYIGGNLGYAFTSSSTLSDSQLSGITNTTSGSFLGGGQVGVNWEFGPRRRDRRRGRLRLAAQHQEHGYPYWYRRGQCRVHGNGEHQQSLDDTGRCQAWLCVGSSAGLRQGRRCFCRSEQFNTDVSPVARFCPFPARPTIWAGSGRRA